MKDFHWNLQTLVLDTWTTAMLLLAEIEMKTVGTTHLQHLEPEMIVGIVVDQTMVAAVH